MNDLLTIIQGDNREALKTLPDSSVQCCVTSPPYWGLRNYGHADQIGQESTPQEYVANMRQVFSEVRRVLKPDGVLWLNLGDSYAANRGGTSMPAETLAGGINGDGDSDSHRGRNGKVSRRDCLKYGLKHKDLVGIPWRVAFSLQEDGWYLRQWIPWVKRNSMPESVTDRPASACEIFFLLTKSEKCHYDYNAVRLPASEAFLNDSRHVTGPTNNNEKEGYADAGAQNPKSVHRLFDKQRGHSRKHAGFNERWDKMTRTEQCQGWRSTRNSDWFFEGMMSNEEGDPLAFVVSTAAYKEAHFATYPPNLIKPCILAGSRTGDTIIDPFFGSGTTGEVALELGRKCIGIELNLDYVAMARRRCDAVTPGFQFK